MTRTTELTCEICGKVCSSKIGLGVHRAKHQRASQAAAPDSPAGNGVDYAGVIADLRARRDQLDRVIADLEALVGP